MDTAFKAQQEGSRCQVKLMGELTIYSVEELKKKLLDSLSECQEMEINLSDVDELDTAGIQLLILLKRESRLADKTLKLVSHSAVTLEVLSLLNMEAHFGDPLVLAS